MTAACYRNVSRRLVPLVAIAILSLLSVNPASKASGLSLNKYTTKVNNSFNKVVSKIPTAWKQDSTTGRPRACWAIEKTLGIATRVVLLGGGGRRNQNQNQNQSSSESPGSEIIVDADSNRSALRGNLSKLSIAVKDSRSPLGLLEVENLRIEGSNLKLGWTPLITTAGVPAILFLAPIRQTVWTLSIYYYLWTTAKRLAKYGASATSKDNNNNNNSNNNNASMKSKAARSIDEKMEATEAVVDRWRKRVLGGSASRLSFDILLSNDNLANSLLLTQSSKFLLRFLMKNSVLQTAAIVGDAVSDNATQNPTTQRLNNNNKKNKNILGASPGKLTRIEQQQQFNFNRQTKPPSKLSRLLSATAFELREAPTFRPEGGKNHLQFVSVAILPDDQARLEFVLRTTLSTPRDPSCLLEFVQPECRFDVTEATSSLPLPKVVSELLPKVLWLPIGSGVAIGGGEGAVVNGSSGGDGLSIRDITVVPGGKCRIGGSISLSQEPPSSRGGLVRW